jgi:hypothetical protein
MAPSADAQTKAKPFQFGVNTLGSWQVGAGKPAAGDTNQYGLYFQKGGVLSDYAAAGASLTPLPAGLTASNLTELSFQIPGTTDITTFNGPEHANGYCSGGSPRFNVHSSGNPQTCFLGCGNGAATQDPTTGWWTVSFTAPFTDDAGCEGGISGTLQSISMIVDEPGNVVVDNITIKRAGQTTVVGAP